MDDRTISLTCTHVNSCCVGGKTCPHRSLNQLAFPQSASLDGRPSAGSMREPRRTDSERVSETRIDGRVERGRRSRRAILDRAMDIASPEGLEALSVRRLATDLDVSKSGVFAQFGSKEELQVPLCGRR
jgi:hypothetical protein